MSMRRKLLALIGALWLLAGCTPQFSRAEMLANLSENIILPDHEALVSSANELATAVAAYNAASSVAGLTALREAWQATSLAWMAVSPYRFNRINDALLMNRIESLPARVPFIEETIAGGEPLTPEFVAGVGSSSQGLGAIEYLIFDATSAADLAANPRRQAYLAGATTGLVDNVVALRDLWSAEGGDYGRIFAEADADGGDLQGSTNMLVNQLLQSIENITWDRIGKPSGRRSNGLVRPELVEAPYSQSSLTRIRATVAALETIYRGGDGPGLDDYLDYLEAEYQGQPLSAAINAQFARTLAALDAINMPLEQAVTEDAAAVDLAFTELRQLITLLKGDMASQLGVTLTFSDNDGD